jgi:hypothetical protein
MVPVMTCPPLSLDTVITSGSVPETRGQQQTTAGCTSDGCGQIAEATQRHSGSSMWHCQADSPPALRPPLPPAMQCACLPGKRSTCDAGGLGNSGDDCKRHRPSTEAEVISVIPFCAPSACRPAEPVTASGVTSASWFTRNDSVSSEGSLLEGDFLSRSPASFRSDFSQSRQECHQARGKSLLKESSR